MKSATARFPGETRDVKPPGLRIFQGGRSSRSPFYHEPEPDTFGGAGGGVSYPESVGQLGAFKGPVLDAINAAMERLASQLSGKASPEDVAKAVDAAKQELTGRIKSASDSAAERMQGLEGRVEALETANAELRKALEERPTKTDVMTMIKKAVQGALRTAAKLIGAEEEPETPSKS